jgi:hypothetical protein
VYVVKVLKVINAGAATDLVVDSEHRDVPGSWLKPFIEDEQDGIPYGTLAIMAGAGILLGFLLFRRK